MSSHHNFPSLRLHITFSVSLHLHLFSVSPYLLYILVFTFPFDAFFASSSLYSLFIFFPSHVSFAPYLVNLSTSRLPHLFFSLSPISPLSLHVVPLSRRITPTAFRSSREDWIAFFFFWDNGWSFSNSVLFLSSPRMECDGMGWDGMSMGEQEGWWKSILRRGMKATVITSVL